MTNQVKGRLIVRLLVLPECVEGNTLSEIALLFKKLVFRLF